MSWPRRHELIDVDLDAYADSEHASATHEEQPAQPQLVQVVEQRRMSVLEAAEHAGFPLETLLPKLG